MFLSFSDAIYISRVGTLSSILDLLKSCLIILYFEEKNILTSLCFGSEMCIY